MGPKSYTHIIYISSDYAKGQRIALHFIAGENFNMRQTESKIYKNSDIASGVSLYTIETDSKSWESVVAKDAFYKNITLIEENESRADPIDIFNKRRIGTVTLTDIAFLIFSVVECNYIEMIVYLYHCYCEYTMQTNKLIGDETKSKIKFDVEGKGPISADLFFGSKVEMEQIAYPTTVNEFQNLQSKLKKYKAKDVSVIASKFFNSPGGAEIMNDCLRIITLLKDIDLTVLFNETINESSIYFKRPVNPSFLTKYYIKHLYRTHFKT